MRDTGPEGVSYRRYAEDTGRFITEFGLHAAPVLETLRRSVPADQLFHHSEAMDHHNKDDPKDKGDNLMAPVTGLPSDLQEYVDFSQLTQAEGLKFAVEHYRRRRPHCSGRARVAAERLLAGTKLERHRLPRLRQGRVLRPAAGVRAGPGLVRGAGRGRRAVGHQRHT